LISASSAFAIGGFAKRLRRLEVLDDLGDLLAVLAVDAIDLLDQLAVLFHEPRVEPYFSVKPLRSAIETPE
jgi:hypothetical protein